jgi:hypothetical protein
LRFRLREALRPLELPRLLSLGALVSESLSTRLDSVRAPDLLCVDEERLDPERLDPDARLRELAFERPFDEDERPPVFEEELLAPERLLLLLDEDLRWGILPFVPPESSVSSCGALTRSQQFNTRLGPAIEISPLGRQFKFHLSG